MWDNALTTKFPHKMSRGQIILKTCPFCENTNFNIEVSIEKGVYHCWICDHSGTVWQLFKELGLKFEDDGLKVSSAAVVTEPDAISLEPYFPARWERYHKFLSSRGLGKEDIERYQLMTALKGKFRDKLIFPLYEGNKLVYIVARSTAPGGRYYNINVNRAGLLPYYLGKIHKTTIYLCEGVIDAISVNKLGYTAAVLLGTILDRVKLQKIEKFGFKTVVICLDGDALTKAIKIFDMVFESGILTQIVLLNKQDDPNAVFVRDKAELKHALKNSREVTLRDRVNIKIKI